MCWMFWKRTSGLRIHAIGWRRFQLERPHTGFFTGEDWNHIFVLKSLTYKTFYLYVALPRARRRNISLCIVKNTSSSVQLGCISRRNETPRTCHINRKGWTFLQKSSVDRLVQVTLCQMTNYPVMEMACQPMLELLLERHTLLMVKMWGIPSDEDKRPPSQFNSKEEEKRWYRDQARHSFRPKVDPKKTSILLFPGQGSQFVGMGSIPFEIP